MPSLSKPFTPNPGYPGAEHFVPDGRLSIRRLADGAQTCRGCPLYKNATQAVFGAGAVKASIMLVGEQPGDQEDKQGRPFVGPAGQLLDKALLEAGIDRRATYLTNAVKHFKWTPDPRGKRRLHAKPNALEVRACRAWLEHELALIKPAVIVALGATAGQALLGPAFRVGAMRGKPIRDERFAAVLVATAHPSAVLRAPESAGRQREFDALVHDLKVAAAAAKG